MHKISEKNIYSYSNSLRHCLKNNYTCRIQVERVKTSLSFNSLQKSYVLQNPGIFRRPNSFRYISGAFLKSGKYDFTNRFYVAFNIEKG